VGVGAHFQQMQRSTLDLRWSLVELTHEAGVSGYGSDLTIEGTIVRDALPRPADALFGDDVIIAAAYDEHAASAVVSGSLLASAARAGVGAFGAQVQLGTSAVQCNEIDLDAETYLGQEPTFVDLGGNECGCDGTSVVCQVLSSELGPPNPLEPPGSPTQ